MKAKDRKQYIEAWNRHITQLHRLACDSGRGDSRQWGDLERELRAWVGDAAEQSFPEPTASGEMPNGEAP